MRHTYKIIGSQAEIDKVATALEKLERGDTRVYTAGEGAIVTTNCSGEDVESVVGSEVKIFKFETSAEGISALEAELKKSRDTIRELIKDKHRQSANYASLQITLAEKVRHATQHERVQLGALLGSLAQQYGVPKIDVTRADKSALDLYVASIETAAQKSNAEKNAAYDQLKTENADLKKAPAITQYSPRTQIADHTLAHLLGVPDEQEAVTEMLDAYNAKVAAVGARGTCQRESNDVFEKLPDVMGAVFQHLKLRLTDAQKENYVRKVNTYLAGDGEWNSAAWTKDKKVNVQDVALAYGKSASWATQQIRQSGLSRKSGTYTWGEISSVFKEE